MYVRWMGMMWPGVLRMVELLQDSCLQIFDVPQNLGEVVVREISFGPG